MTMTALAVCAIDRVCAAVADDGRVIEADVPPRGGTRACFLAGRYEHEVLPATRERLALTGWFRRRA